MPDLIFTPWDPSRPTWHGWVEDASGCHIWTGATIGGYARAPVPYKAPTKYVYRMRYEREVGPIPDGLELDHLCGRGSEGCCNPLHCEPVTHRENLRRGRGPTGKNARKTHCVHGHPLSGANLWIRSNGGRVCRECVRQRNRVYWRAK